MRNLWAVEAFDRPLRNHCDRIATVLQADLVNRGGKSMIFAAAAGSIIPASPLHLGLREERIDAMALGPPSLRSSQIVASEPQRRRRVDRVC